MLLHVNPGFDWTSTRNLIVDILDSFELWDVAVYIMPQVIWRGPAMS